MREKRLTRDFCFVAWVLLLGLFLPARGFAQDKERTPRREGSYQNDFPKAAQRVVLPPVRTQGTLQGQGAPAGVGGLVAINDLYSSIKTVNPRTLTLSPRLLDGQMEGLATEETPSPKGGGLFDAVITPDGKTAVVSNFGMQIVYFLDISNPDSPTVLGSVPITYDTGKVDEGGKPIVYSFFAEDIALTPDGRYLLVTDGGFTPYVALINVRTRTLKTIWKLEAPGVDEEGEPTVIDYNACSCSVAGDGRTVLLTDYFEGKIHVFLMNPDAGTLEYRQSFDTYSTLKEPVDVRLVNAATAKGRESLYGKKPVEVGIRPVNLAISPDGRTAVAVGTAMDPGSSIEDYTSSCSPWVYRVNAPGRVVFKGKVDLPKVARGAQSGAFSRDGSKFYLGVNEYRDPSALYDEEGKKIIKIVPNYVIYVFRVTPEGNLVDTGARVELATARGTSQLFGVETMEVDPENRYLFVSNPTVSGGARMVSVVDLQTLKEVKELSTAEPGDVMPPYTVVTKKDSAPVDSHIPTGIAFPATINDLSVTAASDKGDLSVGDTAVFTVKVKNKGYGHAFGINLKAVLPEGLTFEGATAESGAFDSTSGNWHIVQLGIEDEVTLTLRCLAAKKGNYSLGITVLSLTGFDPDEENNGATLSLVVREDVPAAPVSFLVERVENDMLFFKENLNRLTWKENPKGVVPAVRYRLYRKAKGAADSAYLQIAELSSTVKEYGDRNLGKSDLFTYKLVALSAQGNASSPAVAGN